MGLESEGFSATDDLLPVHDSDTHDGNLWSKSFLDVEKKLVEAFFFIFSFIVLIIGCSILLMYKTSSDDSI